MAIQSGWVRRAGQLKGQRNNLDDLYETLGVARDATAEDIRKAYRKLAKTHHPDLNPGNAGAESRFKAVASANAILSDPVKRGQYDRGEIDAAGQAPPPPPRYQNYAESEAGRRYGGGDGAWDEDELSSIFGSMFNEARQRGGARRGQDERYTLAAGFLEAVNGANRRITLPNGHVLDVKIPPGTTEGQILRLRGQGGEGQGGSAGDALIEISIEPHPYFSRTGQDITLTLPVTIAEAVLGSEIEVPTPGGRVKMRIPPGADTGTKLRLRGKGVPAHGGAVAGDLYAILSVEIGKPDAALENFLRAWNPEHAFNPRRGMEEPK